MARGDSALAIERLAGSTGDWPLARASRDAHVRLRARGSILAMSEALTQYAAYFDASGAAVRFSEIDLFGVYVAPISVMMVAAW